MPELFIGAEGLGAGPAALLATLLHHAAHAAAHARAVKDTGRGGSYHNAKYKDIAIELGLTVERESGRGWSVTALAAATENRYQAEVATLAAAIVAHRRDQSAADHDDQDDDEDERDEGGKPKHSGRSGQALTCRCDPSRRVRAHKRAIDAGPILCGVCWEAFAC